MSSRGWRSNENGGEGETEPVVEPLIHLVIPFAALTLYGLEWREALPLALLALLPDLDVFLHVHRSMSHSLVVVSLVGLPLLMLAYRLKASRVGWLVLLAVASHIALDVFAGYTPILWPLYGNSVWIQTELMAQISSIPTLIPALKIAMEPTRFIPFQSIDAPLLTGKGLIISMVLILPILVKALGKKMDDESRIHPI